MRFRLLPVAITYRQLIFAIVVSLLATAVVGTLTRRDSVILKLAALEATLDQYRLAGRLAPPDGLANSIPPHVFPTEMLQGLGELYLWNCIQLANRTSGKTLKGLVFNGPISADVVNVYLVNDDPQGAFQRFRNNCAYIGSDNIIICDAAFVRTLQQEPPWMEEARARDNAQFLKEFPGLKDLERQNEHSDSAREWGEVLGELRQVNNRQLILWLLGHEMGHLAHNDLARHFIFAGEADSLLIKNFEPPHSQEEAMYSKVEIDADRFAVEAVDQRLLAIPLATGLETAVNRFGVPLMRNGPATSVWLRDDPIVVKRQPGTHPPLFIRAVYLLKELNSRYDLGYSEKIEQIERRIVLVD
jgi:hypothetical protein